MSSITLATLSYLSRAVTNYKPSILLPSLFATTTTTCTHHNHRPLSNTSNAIYLRQRYDQNPTYRAAEIARKAAYHQRQQSLNPEHIKTRERLAWKRRYTENSRGRLMHDLSRWVRKHEWVRTELPWKSHWPVLFENKVVKECEGCTKHLSGVGLLLWWKRRGEERWSCPKCYVPQDDWREALPKGFEDVTSLKELIARKKLLDGQAADGAAQDKGK